MFKIVLAKGAEKSYIYLYKTNRPVFERIRKALYSIARNPHEGKPLRLNLKGKWSYRVGVYRIIYSIEHNILTIYVLEIGHRREIYR